ncbi:MAG: hypothetical protein RTU92_07640, partial [Candidatus Thorarchaeota archaeon]
EGEFDFWSRIEIQFTDGLTATLNDNSNGTTHSVDLRTAYSTTSNYLNKFTPIYSNRYRTQTLYTDDIYVRKFVGTEPGHGEWGSEESLT